MYKKDYLQRKGNDRFDGFLIDMMEVIAQELKFTYDLYVSPDGNYGSKNAEGQWNGMIRELMIGVRTLKKSGTKQRRRHSLGGGGLEYPKKCGNVKK